MSTELRRRYIST